LSEDASTTARVIVASWLPSTVVSLMPVVVTAWAVFQLLDVNVNWAGVTVTSPVSEEVMPMMTSEAGWVLSTTVNESVPPASVVLVDPDVSVVEIPGESSSEVVAVTVWSASASKALSLEVSTTETVTAVVAAGADRLVSGSALFRDDEGLEHAVADLRARAVAAQA